MLNIYYIYKEEIPLKIQSLSGWWLTYPSEK